jgi:hypothetical protein
MTWWSWVLVGMGCWLVPTILLLAWFAVLSLLRRQQPSGEDSVTLS